MQSVRTLALSLPAALALSCSAGEERAVSTFFNALQGGDEAVASGVSLVEFPGEVRAWEIVEVGPEFEEPFELVSMRQRLAERRKELEALQAENQSFGEANVELYRQYHAAREKDPKSELSGKVGDFGADWESRMEKQKELESALEEIQAEIDALRNAARLSLNSMVTDNYAGAVKGKEVRMRIDDGSGPKDYRVVVKRYELADQENNITPMARWIITDIDDQV